MLREKGIQLKLVVEDEIPALIQSDPVRLRQIVLNLTSNAVKFTDAGRVELRVSHQATEDEQGDLTIQVTDTGIGMTAEQVDSMSRFEAFQQADGSMTRRFGGTGLGLRISNSLAELLWRIARHRVEARCGKHVPPRDPRSHD